MKLTWSAIGKLLITGLTTYVVFPAVLILRDFLLWKFINFFILNKNLRNQIRTYATRRSLWNSAFAVDINIDNKDGKTCYQIDGKEISNEEWKQHTKARDNLSNLMNENILFIQRQSKFLDWMLKHYKQDSVNPIDKWLDDESQRMH